MLRHEENLCLFVTYFCFTCLHNASCMLTCTLNSYLSCALRMAQESCVAKQVRSLTLIQVLYIVRGSLKGDSYLTPTHPLSPPLAPRSKSPSFGPLLSPPLAPSRRLSPPSRPLKWGGPNEGLWGGPNEPPAALGGW